MSSYLEKSEKFSKRDKSKSGKKVTFAENLISSFHEVARVNSQEGLSQNSQEKDQ